MQMHTLYIHMSNDAVCRIFLHPDVIYVIFLCRVSTSVMNAKDACSTHLASYLRHGLHYRILILLLIG